MNRPSLRRVTNQQGFSLILVLIVLLVLGGLALASVRLQSLDQRIQAFEVLSLRAFYAAETGAQAYGSQLFPVSGSASLSCAAVLPGYSFSSPGLTDCRGQIENCRLFEVAGSRYLRFESVGQCGAGLERASRRIKIMVQQL